MDENLYTVGQMAKLCNCTSEQLRYYDNNHLISPEVRGNDNNYRYYTEKQIEDILLIKELKNVGLSLKTIAALIHNKDLPQIKNKLEENMHILREELAEMHRRYDLLVDVLLRITNAIDIINEQNFATIGSTDQAFRIVSITKRPIVFTRYQSSYSVEDPFLYRYAELLNIIDKYRLTTSRMISLVFHNHYSKQFRGKASEEMGDLELFSYVTAINGDCPHCRVFGGFKAACATHIGHYRDTKVLYDKLYNWVCAQGFEVSGVSFQELIVGRTITDKAENYVTKIYLPLDVSEI
jgi:DNA-binding transcriptional MerR regulator